MLCARPAPGAPGVTRRKRRSGAPAGFVKIPQMPVHAHNGQIAGLAPEALSRGDRTGFTLFGSALIHVLVIMGIGFTLASPGAVAKIVGAWFTKRRGLAMSLAGTGSAAGETALVPIAAVSVAYIGWREGYMILGAILLFLILPLVLLLLKSRPKPGQHADGYVEGEDSEVEDFSKGSANPNIGMSFGQACRTGLFWRLTIGFFI